MYKLGNERVDGVPVTVDRGEIIVPALNIRQVKALTPDIKKMDAEEDANKKFTLQVKIIREALRRNYPEIEVEEVEDLVDMNNVERVVMAIMGQNKGEVVRVAERATAAAPAE